VCVCVCVWVWECVRNRKFRINTQKVSSQVSISSTFYVRMLFRQLFLVSFWLCQKIRTKNARVWRWWNWLQAASSQPFRSLSVVSVEEHLTDWSSDLHFHNIWFSWKISTFWGEKKNSFLNFVSSHFFHLFQCITRSWVSRNRQKVFFQDNQNFGINFNFLNQKILCSITSIDQEVKSNKLLKF